MTQTLARPDVVGELVENVLIQGDLAKLSSDQRATYYREVCSSLGLNPLTRPFEYITLNGKLTLYARKDCTDQLRTLQSVSIGKLERERLDDLYVVTAYATNKSGRQDSAIGAVSIKGLAGEALANALMKAETKAKRRVTLSLCGLGWSDESETEDIPSTQTIVVDHTTTGEVIEQRDDGERMSAALDQWQEACAEADRLEISHKDLPEGAALRQVERWTLALIEKINAVNPNGSGSAISPF